MRHRMDVDATPILPCCGTSANTTPTFAGYDGPSPVIWDARDEEDLCAGVNEHFDVPDENIVEVEMVSPISMGVVEVHVSGVPRRFRVISGGGDGQRGRTQAQKKLAGVQRSQTSSSTARRAVVDGVVKKASRREGRLAVIDDDELASWGSKDFVDPRPAPVPPMSCRPGGEAPTKPSALTHGTKANYEHCCGTLPPLAPPRKLFDGTPAPPVFQQPTPIEPIRLPFLDSPVRTLPVQTLCGESVPLPDVSMTGPPIIGQTTGTYTSLRSHTGSFDSSMDRVYVQIQDCLSATERMDETLVSCHYINHDSVENVCSQLRRSLREMQRTIDQGSSCVTLDTPEKMSWSRKREAIESSVQKNVRKYYQLATQTAKKPPRINHLNSRIDKLHAYLRKFKDLNVRILASYDTLRILELREQLSSAYAQAKRWKEEEVTHQRDWNYRWRMEKRAVEDLKHDIQIAEEARSSRLMRLMDLKYPPLTSVQNVL